MTESVLINICNDPAWQKTFEDNFQKKYSSLKQKRAESKKNRDQENDPNYLDLEANIITDDSLTSSCCSSDSSCDEQAGLFSFSNVSRIWDWWGSKFTRK